MALAAAAFIHSFICSNFKQVKSIKLMMIKQSGINNNGYIV